MWYVSQIQQDIGTMNDKRLLLTAWQWFIYRNIFYRPPIDFVDDALNEKLEPFRWLIGKWECFEGFGHYPGIQEFKFFDYLEFDKVKTQPVLRYEGSSAHNETLSPMHLEIGFLRAHENCELSFMVSHNFGEYSDSFKSRSLYLYSVPYMHII